MTNPQSTPESVVWVAIDVAKDSHEALIEAPGVEESKGSSRAEHGRGISCLR